MRDILKIEDLPAGVAELADEELEVVAGLNASMKPGTPKLSTALNNDGVSTDTVSWAS